MRKKRRNYSNLVLVVMVFLFVAIYFFFNLEYTGYVVYEENSYTWDFSDSNDYVYDDNINFTSNEIKLKQLINSSEVVDLIEDDVDLILAIDDILDVTDKVSLIDENQVEVKENKVFNITFSDNLDNNDVISFYAEKPGESIIFLCDENIECGGSNYGSVEINGIGFNWYAITITNLSSPTNKFNIDTDKKFNLDYINATHYETNIYNETNFYYYENGSIETNDLEVSNLDSWDNFSYGEILNNQEIKYYYSIDSGENWTLIEDNVSFIESEKIRFKSELFSDTSLTPLLNELSISYRVVITCVENWILNYGECNNDEKLLYYLDGNSCGTIDNVPSDNGTYIDCSSNETTDETTDNQENTTETELDNLEEISVIEECEENWICTEWSLCVDGLQNRTCDDENNCGKVAERPPIKQSCSNEEEKIQKTLVNEVKELNKESPSRGITGRAIQFLQESDIGKISSLMLISIILVVIYFVFSKIKKRKKRKKK